MALVSSLVFSLNVLMESPSLTLVISLNVLMEFPSLALVISVLSGGAVGVEGVRCCGLWSN